MKYDLIIRHGAVVRARGVEHVDVAVSDEKIVEIVPEIAGDARETIDASGLHVFPGMIDPHVHFNEPGRTEWEGIASGSAALVAGGGTCFFDMPLNSSPPLLDDASFDLKLAAMKQKSLADFGLWGGLTPGNLDGMEELAERGVVGFKAFMCDSGIEDFPRADDGTLHRGMEIAARLGRIVAVHAESETITRRLGEQARGRTATDFARSRPVKAEVEAIERAIAMARETGCKLHIVHVSSEAGARAAQLAGADGQISYETCPHYFLLTEDDLVKLGAVAKCAPPVRTMRDVDYLREVLRSGRIGFVASDHSPAPLSMKQGDDFFKIWGGIAGVQSTLPAMLSLEPAVVLERVAALTATNVARRFGIEQKGSIQIGLDADFALVDLGTEFELTREMLLDRHRLSPYIGRRFRGSVRRTIVRGTTVFLNGKIVSKPLGRLVRPT